LASEEARRRGIEVPEVLGVRVDRGGPGLYRGAIVTRWIGDTFSLADLLATSTDASLREAALRAVGTTLRAMHDRGLHHRDLNAGNILLRPAGGGFAVWIIDLDRAAVGSAVSAARRRRALDRLARSLAGPTPGGAFGDAERDVLERAYAHAT
jgi:tRNA A-37 threonylcarbamoyl transferase component Bud32